MTGGCRSLEPPLSFDLSERQALRLSCSFGDIAVNFSNFFTRLPNNKLGLGDSPLDFPGDILFKSMMILIESLRETYLLIFSFDCTLRSYGL